MALRFLGPIRLHEEDKWVDPCENAALSLHKLDTLIDGYGEGDNLSVPSDLHQAVLRRAIWRFVGTGSEAARRLLLALVHDKCSPIVGRFLSPSPASIVQLLDCTLFPSADLFGMMLDGSNLMFQQAHQNELFMTLFWGAFEQLCKSDEHQQSMALLFPLMVFVARCPEELFGFARALARFVVAFDCHDVESLAKDLKGFKVAEEQQSLIAEELAHFLGAGNARILEALVERGVFSAASMPSSLPPPPRHGPFIDMLTPYVTIGYAGAPHWPHHLVSAIVQYINETGASEDADLDALLAGLFYRGCVITEPFHLARRLITVVLHIEEHGCECEVLVAALYRFLAGRSCEIVSEKSRHIHQGTIDKVRSGLALVADFGLHEGTVRAILGRLGVEKRATPGTESQRFTEEQKAFNAPYAMIPLDTVLFVEPSGTEATQLFYQAARRNIEGASLYDRFCSLQSALDPNEQHILGIPAAPLALIFAEEDAGRVPEGSRCVLLKGQ